ncbi:inner membrane component of tripartite multidrug resistance system [Filimonas lacunae]|nr:inner membrane component of tripartite multidrug resistance system [Filimonas lacunae]
MGTNAHVQYINVAGLITGIIIAGILLKQGILNHYIIIAGFLCMAVYHFWFTFLFVPDASLKQIAIPYCSQGVGVGLVFVPLVLYTTSAIPSTLSLSAGFAGVSGRFWGTNIGFCLLQNAKVFLQRNHYSKLQQFVTPESTETQSRLASLTASFTAKGYTPEAAAQLAYQQINASVSRQSMLLSNMEIYTAIGWALVIVVLLLVLSKPLLFSFHKMKESTLQLLPKTLW